MDYESIVITAKLPRFYFTGRMGFEPMILIRYADLANRCLRPLDHLSFCSLKSKKINYINCSLINFYYNDKKNKINTRTTKRDGSTKERTIDHPLKKKRITVNPPNNKNK